MKIKAKPLVLVSDNKINIHIFKDKNNSDVLRNRVYEGVENSHYEHLHLYLLTDNDIIATTNLSLKLPPIPSSYIEEYVNGNKDEVWVEIVDNGSEEWIGDDANGQPFWNEKLEAVITPIKTIFNREEVIKLCKQAFFKGTNVYFPATKEEKFNQFLEENL